MRTQKREMSGMALVHLLLSASLCVLLCVVCFSSYTFAWFSDSVTNANGWMQTSKCSFLVAVYDGTNTEVASADARNAATLTCGGQYDIVVSIPQGNASGYLVLTAGDCEYYSEPFLQSQDGEQTLVFSINVSTPQEVTIAARWGARTGDCQLISGEELRID